ncbi:SIR2 family protein [Aquabacterium sp.]|uniref:SIR2 family protein n=1 Tax=Aquabacterium sp. TaxID=1872578 RepID=UPI0035B11121
MRFIPNGPSIPDELLTARDAGQVLFFCGAGVSLAKAKLPDFVTLAERVLEILGSGLNSSARLLFNQAKAQPGTVATDRIFGLLEREFDPSDVREAVAMALTPPNEASLGAHRLLLDLSRDKAGVPRLVTTNFDVLFEACEPGIDSFNPPGLPDPRRPQDFRGIIHLHGCVDDAYRGARDNEFVLSSADFGHAYLADGWASRYIQSLLQRFRIVFLGYSADDPPVQYLLEALNRFAAPSQSLYAFQAENASEALAQWAHKGVTPIPYDSANHHAALWDTLSAWAGRARDVEAWHQQLLKSASERGPAQMAPHERGMVAHLFSTVEGARFIAGSKTRLPATWLSVIDPQLRYAKPHLSGLSPNASCRFDPFDAYGLDFDEPPAPMDLANHYASREVPEGAWNGLACQVSELCDVEPSPNRGSRGLTTDSSHGLPARLGHIGSWLISIAHQPAALWWAAGHAALHPYVLGGIERRLISDQGITPALRAGWRMAIACMRDRAGNADYRSHMIDAQAKAEGWSTPLVREAINVYKPQLTLDRPFNAMVPETDAEAELSALVRFDVDYPHPHRPIDVPAEFLAYGVGQFRQALEYGLDLEREVTGRDVPYFDTIRADDGKVLPTDAHGLTGHLVLFTNLVSKLAEYDVDAARREVAQWSQRQHQVFIRLKIWAAGRADLTTPEQAYQTVLDLDDETFWSSRQERDLLFSLRDRWNEFSSSLAREIEVRLLTSDIPWLKGQPDLAASMAHIRLNRLHWLSSRGVQFNFDYGSVFTDLRILAPEWDEQSAQQTAQPQVSEAFFLTMDVDPTEIDRLPLGEVLAKVQALAGNDFFARLHRDPFLGLAKSRPSRALSVLTCAKKKGSFPASAWWSFLTAQAEESSRSRRLLIAIAARLARLNTNDLVKILQPASTWTHNEHQRLQHECLATFEALWSALMDALRSPITELPRSRSVPRRWVDEGLNSPAGRLAMAQRQQLAEVNQEFKELPRAWKLRTEELLSLPQDHRNHVIAMIAADVGRLYQADQRWTAEQLLTVLARDDEMGVAAFWDGFLWGARGIHADLFPQLKAGLMKLAQAPELADRDQTRSIAGLLLATWSDCKRRADSSPQLSDVELREVLIQADDRFRMQMLWYVEHWCKDDKANWSEFLIPFLTKVWPRQLAARTPSASARLVALALALPDRFLEIADAVQRQLVVSNNSFMNLFNEEHKQIAERHPLELLAILSASLGEDPSSWPYEIGKLLAVLAEQPLTRSDPRLIMLREREQRGMR